MTDVEQLQTLLSKSRNADGGWPSRRGRSWTEPTALSLLALQGAVVPGEARALTAAWLAGGQSLDGGWPPSAQVSQSTWVTSLALLALAQEAQYSLGCPKGCMWLSGHVYPQPTRLQGYLQNTLGIIPDHAPGSSSWFPGTAGWVIPTAFSILALSCWSEKIKDQEFDKAVVHRAQSYLLSRRCLDGGWNHGGSPHRSETAPSYPETTGLALLALAGQTITPIKATLQFAMKLLQNPESNEGLCWLAMGLAAHGIFPKGHLDWSTPPRTNQDAALRLLALQTVAGRNPFLQKAL